MKTITNRRQAISIHHNGDKAVYFPTFRPGDPQTKSFALSSARSTLTGGVSLVIGRDATNKAIRGALKLLIAELWTRVTRKNNFTVS